MIAHLLDTFSFLAPQLYVAWGYERFATLDDYPAGQARYFYYKDLQHSRLSARGDA